MDVELTQVSIQSESRSCYSNQSIWELKRKGCCLHCPSCPSRIFSSGNSFVGQQESRVISTKRVCEAQVNEVKLCGVGTWCTSLSTAYRWNSKRFENWITIRIVSQGGLPSRFWQKSLQKGLFLSTCVKIKTWINSLTFVLWSKEILSNPFIDHNLFALGTRWCCTDGVFWPSEPAEVVCLLNVALTLPLKFSL